jgi:uncharacterized protein
MKGAKNSRFNKDPYKGLVFTVWNRERNFLEKKTYSSLLILFFITGMGSIQAVHAQSSSALVETLAVVGRPSSDSIMLRWAPLKLSIWQTGNSNGYRIERYVMARDGRVLDLPEKVVLNNLLIKPLAEELWEPLVRKNSYAAVAAQALYGDRFEIDLSKSDIFQIVNKVRENEQRFSFALFCADISPAVAKALGLLYVDKDVRKGEKYVYRIIVDQAADSLRGSIFISPDDNYSLPPPSNLTAEFNDNLVSLRWDKFPIAHYTAFILERSSDGKSFLPTSKTPTVTISPTELEDNRYEYAADSVPDLTNTYYYRVRGLTPFGEKSEPSGIVSGKGKVMLSEVPYITSDENIQNQSIRLVWSFPEYLNNTIKGFSVERSETPRGNYNLLTKSLLPKQARTYEDSKPGQVNYYRVAVYDMDGKAFQSPVYLAQLVDSIPPDPPSGLRAVVNDHGHLELTWQPNHENDLYGYRIYRANFDSEELFQVTTEPIRYSKYIDTVNLNTLNENVYYQVMALDRNQNHSALSDKLKVLLPDKVKPQSPVFLPIRSDARGIKLQWQVSGSQDVVRYDLYRQRVSERQWIRIKALPATTDTIYYYTDSVTQAGIVNTYTVVAIDEAGLESEPSAPVRGQKIDNRLHPQVRWGTRLINREKNTVMLKWNYKLPGVRMYRLYKSQDNSPEILYKSIPAEKQEFSETLMPGRLYKYKIMAVFQNGKMSALSDEIAFNY